LWDFFECNWLTWLMEVLTRFWSLNSLCGISSNATAVRVKGGGAFRNYELSIPFVGFLRMQPWKCSAQVRTQTCSNSQFPLWDFFECNICLRWLMVMLFMFLSQFPLWDFFECNRKEATGDGYKQPQLSIPFVGFLRMQHTAKITGGLRLTAERPLSIPFVGFLRMQHVMASVRVALSILYSQFPLWDFFECNKKIFAMALRCLQGQLSIPFVGFLRMQRIRYTVEM